MKISLAILIALFLFLQCQLWFVNGGYFRAWRLREQLAQERCITAKLTKRNQELEAEKEDLKQGHEAVEELARDQLGMIKKGETFYRIILPS